MRGRRLLLGIAVGIVSLGCTSPEATRMRGGGPGGDPGNHGAPVRMHAGSEPYHDTPRLVEPWGLDDLDPARQARHLATGEGGFGSAADGSASPTERTRR